MYIHMRTRYSSRPVVYPRTSLAAPAALENSPVVSQIDIVRRPKVRRCLWQVESCVCLHVQWLCVRRGCGIRRGVRRYVPPGCSSRNIASDALSPPQGPPHGSQIMQRGGSYARNRNTKSWRRGRNIVPAKVSPRSGVIDIKAIAVTS